MWASYSPGRERERASVCACARMLSTCVSDGFVEMSFNLLESVESGVCVQTLLTDIHWCVRLV